MNGAVSRQDLAALQGVWEQVAFEDNGVTDAPDAYGNASLTTFNGNHFAVHSAAGALLLEGTFTLDASAIPKRVDWTDAMGPDKDQTLLAIYTLKGDHFAFIAADPGSPRPVEFRTRSGQTMRGFVRRR